MLKVTDIHTGQTATIESCSELPDVLREWFTGAPIEVLEAIEESAQETDETLINYFGVRVDYQN